MLVAWTIFYFKTCHSRWRQKAFSLLAQFHISRVPITDHHKELPTRGNLFVKFAKTIASHLRTSELARQRMSNRIGADNKGILHCSSLYKRLQKTLFTQCHVWAFVIKRHPFDICMYMRTLMWWNSLCVAQAYIPQANACFCMHAERKLRTISGVRNDEDDDDAHALLLTCVPPHKYACVCVVALVGGDGGGGGCKIVQARCMSRQSLHMRNIAKRSTSRMMHKKERKRLMVASSRRSWQRRRVAR